MLDAFSASDRFGSLSSKTTRQEAAVSARFSISYLTKSTPTPVSLLECTDLTAKHPIFEMCSRNPQTSTK